MRAEEVFSLESPDAKSAAATMHVLRWRQKIVVVGGSESGQSLRASILRARGLEVDVAKGLTDCRALCQGNAYDWVVLDTHSLFPGEVIDCCEQLKQAVAQQRIAFFGGAPSYISLKWPAEHLTEDKGKAEPVTEFKTAA